MPFTPMTPIYKQHETVFISNKIQHLEFCDKIRVTDEMRALIGRKATITLVCAGGAYFIDIDNSEHYWTNGMFSKTNHSPFQQWEKDAGVNETCST